MAAAIRENGLLAGWVTVPCGTRQDCSNHEIALLTGMYKHQRLEIPNECVLSVKTAFRPDIYREISAVGFSSFLTRIIFNFILRMKRCYKYCHLLRYSAV
jgi:hypothetical protein